MADGEQIDAQELAMLVKRLDRQRRARRAADAISEHATSVLYEKQQHLRLLQAVAVAANESPSVNDALQTAVDQICTHLEWPVGHAYLAIGDPPVLTLSNIWFLDDLEQLQNFRTAVEATFIEPTSGLTGEAFSQRAPVIVTDLTAVLPLPLSVAAGEAGLKSALAFPVVGVDGPLALLEFFSREPIVAEEMLVEVITKIGELLGQVHIRTRAAASLTSSEEQYRLLFQGNPHPMWIHDADSLDIISVNDAALSRYGFSRDELRRMKITDIHARGEEPRDGLVPLRKKDGTVVMVDVSGYDVALPGRRGRIMMAVDADEGRRAAEALRESERRFREMLDTIELAAVLLDVIGTVTYCNPNLLKSTGYTKGEVIGANFFDLFLPPDRRAAASRDFADSIGRGAIAAHDEMEIVTRSGERRVVLWNNTVLRNPEGSVLGAASIGSDVTEQRRVEKQLLHNAFHDSLTGLPNRALFLDRVEHALTRVQRERRRAFAVLLLDIDHFKNVNDSLGHAAGDALLVEVGERLARCVRAADTVARFGGDEFTILIEQVIDAADATRTAGRVHEAIAEPFRIGETEFFATASVGIIVAGAEYESAEQIVRDADTAMYRAKMQGRARSEIFDAAMRAEVVQRLQMEIDLRHALDQSELLVFYQPIVLLGSGEITGYEALLRWNHATRGFISPSEFIPMAEESALVVPIGAYVLEHACRQAVKWAPQYVSVNISGRHFAQGDLLVDVKNALSGCGLAAGGLLIEVTESAIVQHPEEALAVMHELRALGCRIALDDFGTGYSSLSYLHRFPIDRLKIDASFVRDITRDRKNVEIIRTIIALGRSLGMGVIAEGIETEEQRALLQSLGCEMGQGYLFARPMPV